VKLQLWEKTLTEATLKQVPPAIVAILKTPAAKRTPKQKATLSDFYAVRDPELVKLTRNIVALQNAAPGPSLAQVIARGKKARKTHVMIRGDFLRPGVEVSPGTPAVLPAGGGAKTRLELVKWLVDPKNPLTSRVAVNWAWQRFFGRGLVATPDDFGTQGDKPSHPELLDWLAREVLEQGWSLKKLHRLIVTSATYRQSSKVREELTTKDPYNVLLARQVRQRLEAEVIRDVALASSGLLVPLIGGPSVRPPQPAGISELTYAGSA